MASLCLCGIGNCDGDDDMSVCPNFLRKQHEEFLRLSYATLEAQQAYALAQAEDSLAQIKAQAQAQVQLEYAQQQFAAFKAREEQGKGARVVINVSGVNVVPCHLCDKDFNSLQGLKTHMRSHYNPFTCDVCGFVIANTAVARRHNITCQNLDFMKAYCYFHSEDFKLMREHKFSFPEIWENLPHYSF